MAWVPVACLERGQTLETHKNPCHALRLQKSNRTAVGLSRPSTSLFVCASKAWMPGTRPGMTSQSNIPAFDLLAQRLHLIRDFLHVRVDRERLAVGVERLPVLADLLQDHPKAGERPEVTRIAVEHFLDVGHRAPLILQGEEQRVA